MNEFLLGAGDIFRFVMVVGIISIMLGKPLSKRRRNPKANNPNAPVLLGSLVGMDMLNAASGNTPKGNHYDYVVAGVSLFSHGDTHGLCSVELPYVSGVHLVGLPTASTLRIKGKALEPVVLEGDYPNHFMLYADKGQQSKSRYVLHPEAMAFTIDFCHSYEWEIIEDTLYFLNSGRLPPLSIVDAFIETIRPAIEVESDRARNPYRMSYTNTSGRIMECPLCQKRLLEKPEWMECPDQHGYLVTGKQLIESRKKSPPEVGTVFTAVDHEHSLECPYCHNPMKSERFQLTAININVCTKCRYRWVDAAESSMIFGT